MKIAICGSMAFSNEMVETAGTLEDSGHKIIIPRNADKYADGTLKRESSIESIENKIKDDLIKDYFNKIKKVDAVLIMNLNKDGIENYIGGNSLIEMSFAYVLGKKIYLYNDIPQMGYTDEIVAMQPIIINQNLSKIL